MPITAGAIRKQRADRRRAVVNQRSKNLLKEVVAAMRRKPTKTHLRELYVRLDRATKTGVVHRNKAGRLKSRLARLVGK